MLVVEIERNGGVWKERWVPTCAAWPKSQERRRDRRVWRRGARIDHRRLPPPSTREAADAGATPAAQRPAALAAAGRPRASPGNAPHLAVYVDSAEAFAASYASLERDALVWVNTRFSDDADTLDKVWSKRSVSETKRLKTAREGCRIEVSS